MEIILHIGTVKTGTTAFQEWLAINADALRRAGVWVPTSVGGGNHTVVALAIRHPGQVDPEMRNHGITSVEEHAQLTNRVSEDLRAELTAARRAGARAIVISSEHFTFRTDGRNDLHVIDTWCRPGDRVRVVCSVRPQVDTMLSLASTNARHGHRIDEDWLQKRVLGSSVLHYAAVLQPWQDHFGSEAVEVVPYKRYPALWAYLAPTLGIDLGGLADPPRKNTALDARVLAFTNHLGSATIPGRALNRAGHLLDEFPHESGLTISRDRAERFQAIFTEENAALVATWPLLEDGDLDTDLDRHPEAGSFDTLDDLEFADVTKHLLIRLGAERWLAEAGRDLANARLSIVRGDPAQARRLATAAGRKATYVLDIPAVADDADRTRSAAQALLASRALSAATTGRRLVDAVRGRLGTLVRR